MRRFQIRIHTREWRGHRVGLRRASRAAILPALKSKMPRAITGGQEDCEVLIWRAGGVRPLIRLYKESGVSRPPLAKTRRLGALTRPRSPSQDFAVLCAPSSQGQVELLLLPDPLLAAHVGLVRPLQRLA